MKAKNYSVNLHWDKRYPKVGTSECPIQLAVNISGLQFKVGLRLYSTQADYLKALNGKGGSEDVRELRRQINEYVTKAEKILDRLPHPTREIFQRLFKSECDVFQNSKTDITLLFEEYAIQLRKEERIKSAVNLDSSLISLKKYKPTIYFEDIDEAWLKNYKAWMTKQGNSPTTTQIYLRNLRTIFNKAIKDGYISSRFYPFKDYKIGSSSKSKNVLYAPQLKALWDYQGRIMRETRSKDMFFMCYLTNGCNFKDIAYLKWKDIKGDTLTFVREKTKRTNTSEKQITVHMHDEIKRIIATWGNESRRPDDYVFPILNDRMTAIQKEKRRQTFQRLCNRMLNIIGKNLEFDISLSLNLARHSFATTLKLSGTPTSFISDSLGHASGKTTEHYLKSLPTDKVREISNSLLNFNQPQP